MSGLGGDGSCLVWNQGVLVCAPHGSIWPFLGVSLKPFAAGGRIRPLLN